MDSTTPVRVVLVDDEPSALAGLKALLDTYPEIEVVGTAGDGEQAVASVRTSTPDVLVMDVIMPRLDGIEATRRIKRDHPNVRILLLTTYGAVEHDGRAAGADMMLLKVDSDEEIVEAILRLGG
jgi:DNA-binding NarL/FixJ family response regulator